MENPSLVSIIMGSQSDWPIMKHASKILKLFNIKHEVKIISAHRTPDRMYDFAKQAENTSIQVIIAGAGGAAHLPGMIASHSNLPVIGVPIQSSALNGMDSLLSIVQMPAGVPVATMSIGKAGAINAAIYAAKILSLSNDNIGIMLKKWLSNQTNKVPENPEKND